MDVLGTRQIKWMEWLQENGGAVNYSPLKTEFQEQQEQGHNMQALIDQLQSEAQKVRGWCCTGTVCIMFLYKDLMLGRKPCQLSIR